MREQGYTAAQMHAYAKQHADALEAELAGLTASYEERTAYTIVHRGHALMCSDAMRGAYSDEHHRANRAEAELAALKAMIAGMQTQWRHNAQGCTRHEAHAAGTWRSCARELAALLAATEGE